ADLDLDGSFGLRPLDVAPRRAVDPVLLVAAGNDLEVAATALGDVGEPVGQLHRQPGPGVALDLAVLPATVLVPLEPERLGHPDGRVDVEVGVGDMDVPSEDRQTLGEAGGGVSRPR